METRDLLGLVSRSNNKTLDQLLSTLPEPDRPLAELQIMKLARDGTIELRKKDGVGYYVNAREPLEERNNNQEKIISLAKAFPEIEIVSTLPASLLRNARMDGRATTDKVFKSILRRAKKYIKLCIPFPEEPIVSYFADEIAALAIAGVGVKVLTREVYDGNRNSRSYGNLLKTLLRITDLYSYHGDRSKIEIRDFHVGLNISRFDVRHYESVHAKIALADGILSYVGSGEWRVNSLYNNFELGVLLKGSIVKQVEESFDLVWTYSRPVYSAFLKDTARQNRQCK